MACIRNKYRISYKNKDETEEVVWESCCSRKKADQMFLEFIQKQSGPYHKGEIDFWRQVRLYENDKLIATES